MQLQQLSFADHESGWRLSNASFFPDLTLLVGITGVGKTRILQAIRALRQVADGSEREPHWGIQYDAAFSDGASDYSWSCEFEARSLTGDEDDLYYFGIFAEDDEPVLRPRLLRERLTRNDETLIDRDSAGIRLRGQPTPKLSPNDSAIKMLSQEEGVSGAHQSFQRILFVDRSEDVDPQRGAIGVDKLIDKYPTLDSIRESRLDTLIKLALVQDRHSQVFEAIACQFMEVFPQVEAIKIERKQVGGPAEVLSLRLKERGVSKWIREPYISSGMARTIMHLARIALWPDGTLILIDEFVENSLGVNCIDFITKSLVEESRRLQFIITSHHPYIINNINPDHWKIVGRHGSEVTTRDASELGLEQSSHQAFIKLLNSEAYQEGIALR